MLAWIRTGIALMGFGFVVARFGIFLRELVSQSPETAHGSKKATVTGAVLVAAGVLVNVWASVRHTHMIQRLRRGEINVVGFRGPLSIGIATSIGGAIVLVILVSAFFQ